MKAKQVKVGSIETIVKIIDWKPINKIISNRMGMNLECRLGNGMLLDIEAVFKDNYDVKEKRCIIIDNECCGKSNDKVNHFSSDLNEGEPFAMKLFKEVPFYKIYESIDGKQSVSMFPSYHFDIDVDDIKKCLTGEEMPLYLFMGSRYQYNPRIMSNEMEILKLVYYNHIENKMFDWQKSIEKVLEY